MNGPKGMDFFLSVFLNSKIIAKNPDDKTVSTKAFITLLNPIIVPHIPISLMSPPPIPFLKNKTVIIRIELIARPPINLFVRLKS